MSMAKRQSLGKGDDRLNSALTVTKVYAGNKTKRSPYRTKSRTSEVDETLFGSPVRYNQQKETKRTSDRSWDPPWSENNNNNKTTGGFLMWSPTRPGSSNSCGQTVNTPRSVYSPRPINIDNSPSRRTPIHSNLNSARSNYSSTSPRPPMSARSQKYRLRKHTDTFVDESLFGTTTDATKNLSYKDRYETKEKVPFMANSAWSSPVKH